MSSMREISEEATILFKDNFTYDNMSVVLASTIVWLILHVLSHYASLAIFPKTYGGLGPKQPFWNIRVVSTIHAVLVCFLAVPLLTDEVLQKDVLYGRTDMSNLLTCIAAGYFLYDLLGCLFYFSEFGVSFTLHGLLCFLVYFLGLRPFLHAFSPVFLLFELSTPFLNVNWFLDKLGMTGSTLQFVNGLALVITFIGARIVFGYYASFLYWQHTFDRYDEIHSFLFIFFGLSNVALTGLNTLWLVQMIKSLRRRFTKPKTT